MFLIRTKSFWQINLYYHYFYPIHGFYFPTSLSVNLLWIKNTHCKVQSFNIAIIDFLSIPLCCSEFSFLIKPYLFRVKNIPCKSRLCSGLPTCSEIAFCKMSLPPIISAVRDNHLKLVIQWWICLSSLWIEDWCWGFMAIYVPQDS